MTDGADAALLTAAALHLGFQLTVTLVVYPALARVEPERWTQAHDAHSRSITPVVVVTYAALLAGVGWALASDPDTWTLVAAAGAALSLGGTAFVAAPTHARLAAGPDPRLLRRLLAADRVRTVGAATCACGALLGCLR